MRSKYFSGMSNSAGVKIIVLLILFVLTILLSNVISQYEISGDELLVDSDFDNKLFNGQQSGNVAVISSGSKTVVQLKSEDTRKIVAVRQMLDNVPKGEFVQLSGKVKIKGVSSGDEIWHAARIIFVAIDYEGQSMYNVPHVLVMRNGSTDWVTYEKVFIAASNAVRYYVELQLVNVTGVMWVKNLSLRPVKEALSFRVFQSVCALLWLVVILWILAPYRRTMLSSKWSILVTLMLIVALFSSLASTDLKHGFIEWLKPILPWTMDEAEFFRVGHFFTYCVISIVVFMKVQSVRLLMICLGLLIIFSMATEVLQYLVDGRTPRISDFLVDVSGVIIGLFISYMLSPSMRTSLKQEVR